MEIKKEHGYRFTDNHNQSEFFKNSNTLDDIKVCYGNFKWKLPNMILITSDGRNVGKTTFACKIIHHLAKQCPVAAVKTSSHFHPIDSESEIIVKNDNFIIIREKAITRKDSSLMLQAGASRAYFMMVKPFYLEKAFSCIAKELIDYVVVAESGSLNEVIRPACFFFVRNTMEKLRKTYYLKYNPKMVYNINGDFDFDVKNLDLKNNCIVFRNRIDEPIQAMRSIV